MRVAIILCYTADSGRVVLIKKEKAHATIPKGSLRILTVCFVPLRNAALPKRRFNI